MSRLPEQYVDLLDEDRFCSACGGNLRGCAIVREAHYDMHVVRCPDCGHLAHVERRPLTRTGQRWAGLTVAFWLLGLLALWTGTNAGLYAITIGVVDESQWQLAQRIRALYEDWHPEDAGGTFETSVQFTPAGPAASTTPTGPPAPPVPVAPGATGAGQTPSVQVFPAGPGRQVVIRQQDEALRSRFGRWWSQQDPKAVLAQAGGYGEVIAWRDMWPWLLLGFIPLCFGFAWSTMLLNVSRRRLLLAWPFVAVWYIIAAALTVPARALIPVESPGLAAICLLTPVLVPIIAAYALGALLVGLLVGRGVMRGAMRLVLSPRACSALAFFWHIDGKRPPRVRALAG